MLTTKPVLINAKVKFIFIKSSDDHNRGRRLALKQVFYMQDEKRSFLRLRPDRLAYLICTSDGKDKAMIEEMRIKNPVLSKIELLKMIANSKVN